MKSFDVIVLGVGGMGSAACYHLAKRGCRVLGLEQFQLRHENGSSHGETRMIRQAYFEHPDYVPLLKRAYELWDELETASGRRIFEKNGLVIYGEPGSSSIYNGVLRSAERYGIPIERFSRNAALERFPLFRPPNGYSAVFEPGAGFIYVDEAARAHTDLAERHGAVIRQSERVVEYLVKSSRIEVTTDQDSYSAEKLVVTAGPWNMSLLREIGAKLKLFRVTPFWFRASLMHKLENRVPCFGFHLPDDFYYGFPMLDEKTVKAAPHFTKTPISRPEEKNASNPETSGVSDFLTRCLPNVSTELDRFSSCIYSMTSDENFLIDCLPSNPGIVFAAGFSGHGFKFTSVVGEIMAELACEGETRQPIDFLRLR